MAHTKRSLYHYYLLAIVVVGLMGLVAVVGWVLWSRDTTDEPTSPVVAVQRDIHYCNTSNPYQGLDLYRPQASASAVLPVVVYIHGGGWRSGSKNNALIATYAKVFAEHNIATISVAYRLQVHNPFPEQNEDVACALEYIEQHAHSLRVNPDNMVFFGDSAGGDLAAFAALNIPYKQYDYDAPRGVIDFYGVSDFSKIVEGSRPDFNARRYLGSAYNQVASAASPTSYVTKKSPRFLFIHGTNDKVVPITQSKELYQKLAVTGIDAEYVAVPGAPHGFIGPELGDKDYQLIQGAVTSFLSETMGG